MPKIRIKSEHLVGATQDKLGKALGVDRTLVSRFRKGERFPDNQTMARIIVTARAADPDASWDDLFEVVGGAA